MRIILICERRSMLGVETILDAEGITYRHGLNGTGSLVRLLAAEDVVSGAIDSEQIAGERVVVLAGGNAGSRAAEYLTAKTLTREPLGEIVRVSTDALPAGLRTTLAQHGFSEVELPVKGSVASADVDDAEVLIQTAAGERELVMRWGKVVVVSVDLGAAMLDLLTESYVEVAQERQELSGPLAAVYRAMPFRLRLLAYAFAWRRLRRGVEREPRFSTRFPIDPAGWIVHQLLVHAIEGAGLPVPRVWRWPDGASCALCLTHDIEPREYAYEKGLPRLLDLLAEEEVRASISIVARPEFDLPASTIRRAHRDGHEVISHGLLHDGLFNQGDSGERTRRVSESVRIIGEIIGHEVTAFRTPWLQRTRDIVGVLEESGITCDSSLVDSDTSMKKAWHGSGISYNYPHRLITREGDERRSDVIELPIAGPQDMELVFAGFGLERATDALVEKLRWSRSIGAAHTVIVHAGVYGDSDSDMRESLLRAIITEARGSDPWIAPMSQVAQWWGQREALGIELVISDGEHTQILLANPTDTAIEGVWLDLGPEGTTGEVLCRGETLQTKTVSGRSLANVGTLGPGEEVVLDYSGPSSSSS